MRRYILSGTGLVLAAAGAAAQSPRPAARIAAVQGLTDAELAAANRTALSRGQAPGVPMPMPPGANPSTPLAQPTPVVGPGVVEQRGPVTYPLGGVFAPQGAAGVPYTGAIPAPTYPVAGMPMDAGSAGVELDDPLFAGCAPAGPAYGGALAGGPTTAFNKWWVYGEYLHWWTRRPNNPPLLTTSSAAFNGILGAGDTRVLYPNGSGSLLDSGHSGFRGGVGYWFGTEQRWGIEGSGFFLGRNATTFNADTNSFPLLARPFTNLNQGIGFSELVAAPGLATGSASITESLDLYGADVNLRRYLAKTNCARLDLLGGFRFVQMNEGLSITERFARTPNSDTGIGVPTALSGTVIDEFKTTNRFYGAQIGLAGELRRGRWYTQATGKVAFGKMYQTVDVAGSQDILFNDGTRGLSSGGLLAVPGANIGRYTRDRFAVVPELGLNIGYHITPGCRVYVGYTFLYMSNVLRPGDQIDTGLDVARIPNFPVAGVTPLAGEVRPAVRYKDADFFAQGINVGLQFTW
jgi:hypothetical protein